MIRWLILPLTILFGVTDCRGQSDTLCFREMKVFMDTCFHFISQNRFDRAIPYAQRMEPFYGGVGGDSMKLAGTYYLEGELYRLLERHESALDRFRRAVDLYGRLDPKPNDPGNRGQYALSVSRMGHVYLSYGDQTDGELYLKKALPLLLRFNMMGQYAQDLLSVGGIASDRGNYTEALALNEKAMSILDTLPTSPFGRYLQLSIHNNEAMIYAEEGNGQKALANMRASLRLLKTTDLRDPDAGFYIKDDYVPILMNAADTYFVNGMDDSAMVECRAADSLIKVMPRGRWMTYLSQERAIYAEKKGRLDEAIDLMRQGIRIGDTAGVRPDNLDQLHTLLGSLYNEAGRYREADSLFRIDMTGLRRRGLTYSYFFRQDMFGLCTSLVARGSYQEGTDSLVALSRMTLDQLHRNTAGLSESEQVKFKQGLEQLLDLLYTCLSQGHYRSKILRDTYLLELEQKNLVLNGEESVLAAARRSGDTVYHAWLANRQVLSQQYGLPLNHRQFQLDSLEAAGETWEKKLNTHPGAYDSRYRGLPVLPPGSATVEFLGFHPCHGRQSDSVVYAAFVLRSGDTLPTFVRLCNEETLHRLLTSVPDEDQLTEVLYDGRHRQGRTLYDLVWRPLDPLLAGTPDVSYSPAGLLNNISFQAIFTGRDYLVHRYRLHRYLDLADRSRAAPGPPERISVWGNIDYDSAAYSQEEPSEALALEAEAVRKDMGSGRMARLGAGEVTGLQAVFAKKGVPFTSVQGARATEERFKQEAAECSGVLHVSTHGFYTPFRKDAEHMSQPGLFIAATVNPLFRCGIAFAGANYYWLRGVPRTNREDGILTGYEIEQIDLHRVQLVTLSACETGLGDVTENEGTLGLQRAFRLAGVRLLLVSLWQVPARQTSELLSLFYAGWLDGKDPGAALQDAENALRAKGYPPYYWAGFVLIE